MRNLASVSTRVIVQAPFPPALLVPPSRHTLPIAHTHKLTPMCPLLATLLGSSAAAFCMSSMRPCSAAWCIGVCLLSIPPTRGDDKGPRGDGGGRPVGVDMACAPSAVGRCVLWGREGIRRGEKEYVRRRMCEKGAILNEWLGRVPPSFCKNPGSIPSA